MSMLARWAPFNQMLREMDRLQQEMNQFFGPVRADRNAPLLGGSFPPINVWEDEDHVYAEAELPGLNLENLEITVNGQDQLTVKGTREAKVPEKAVWHRQERGFGTFTRVITLPVPVDADNVEARLEHGVLTIRMPKSPAAKPRRITVKAE